MPSPGVGTTLRTQLGWRQDAVLIDEPETAGYECTGVREGQHTLVAEGTHRALSPMQHWKE